MEEEREVFMATILNDRNMSYKTKKTDMPEYNWQSMANIDEKIQAKNLKFNVRILGPGQYSYPYHSHRHAEELFVVLEGEALLRTPEGIEKVMAGDVIFFEMGPSGAHQLKNESDKPFKYVDIRTFLGMDVCDYPDSGKVNILPDFEQYETKDKVDYFKGEKDVKAIW